MLCPARVVAKALTANFSFLNFELLSFGKKNAEKQWTDIKLNMRFSP